MSGIYDKLGVRFLYPESWRVIDEDGLSWPRTVSVQSPKGGFWSLMIYRSDQEPGTLTEQVVAAMRAEYDDVEAIEVTDSFADTEAIGYHMQFYCLDFVVASRTLAARAADHTLLLLWQAEDREFEELEMVFRAITTSLFSKQLPV